MLNFNEIYKAELPNVINYINWKLNNIHDAEDVAVEVFSRVFKHLPNFDESKSSFSSWLRTITNTSIVDFIRYDKPNTYSKSVSDFVNAEGEERFNFIGDAKMRADFKVENDELSERLNKAFSTLKPKYRKIAVLYFMKDESYEKIAEICNVPIGTVKGMLNRTREKLQNDLKNLHNVRKSNVHEPVEYVDHVSYDEFQKIGQK